MPTVYRTLDEMLEPIAEELKERLTAKLKNITNPAKREEIFTAVIVDVMDDIEGTLREMLTEFDQ